MVVPAGATCVGSDAGVVVVTIFLEPDCDCDWANASTSRIKTGSSGQSHSAENSAFRLVQSYEFAYLHPLVKTAQTLQH